MRTWLVDALIGRLVVRFVTPSLSSLAHTLTNALQTQNTRVATQHGSSIPFPLYASSYGARKLALRGLGATADVPPTIGAHKPGSRKATTSKSARERSMVKKKLRGRLRFKYPRDEFCLTSALPPSADQLVDQSAYPLG